MYNHIQGSHKHTNARASVKSTYVYLQVFCFRFSTGLLLHASSTVRMHHLSIHTRAAHYADEGNCAGTKQNCNGCLTNRMQTVRKSGKACALQSKSGRCGRWRLSATEGKWRERGRTLPRCPPPWTHPLSMLQVVAHEDANSICSSHADKTCVLPCKCAHTNGMMITWAKTMWTAITMSMILWITLHVTAMWTEHHTPKQCPSIWVLMVPQRTQSMHPTKITSYAHNFMQHQGVHHKGSWGV